MVTRSPACAGSSLERILIRITSSTQSPYLCGREASPRCHRTSPPTAASLATCDGGQPDSSAGVTPRRRRRRQVTRRSDRFRARVEALGDRRDHAVDLLDHRVPALLLDDLLDRPLDVTRPDEEARRMLTHVLVLLERDLDVLRTGRVAALADELSDLRFEPAGGLSDLFVDVAEERFGMGDLLGGSFHR